MTLLQAQEGLNATQYKALKQLRIANPERETYLVFDEAGFILDRYEMKPASVFRFSDSLERRLYLYLVYPADREDTVGLFLYYQRQDQVIALPVPGQTADKAAWALYLDDLKYTGEAEPGWLATVSFLLSKELAGLLEGKTAAMEDEDDYEYCFPSTARVTMADGSQRPIAEVQPGDLLLGADPNTTAATLVTGVDLHRRAVISLFLIVGLESSAPLATSQEELPVLRQLQLTGNHPVWTARGRVEAKNLLPGDQLLVWAGNDMAPLVLLAVEPDGGTVGEVWTLNTEGGQAFWVENILVLPK